MFELKALLEVVGYAGIFAIIFAESGLLIGFFLPGDSLLFTAGFLAAQGIFNIYWLAVLCFVAAVLGDSAGYTFGSKVGRRIFTRENSILFHTRHLQRAQAFYDRHGGKTIILARFLPVVRTFAPVLAGVGSMPYPRFLKYNVVGGALWAIGLTVLGYFLGSVIPDVDQYLLPTVFAIIVLSVLPTMVHFLWNAENRGLVRRAFRRVLRRATESA